MGFSLDIALKLTYTIATLVAWLGWGLLFGRIISLINNLSVISSILAIILAIFLPVYFTFDWCGTDIFLFCGIPFIIYFYDLSDRWKNYYFIGAIIGLMYFLRYASAFLLVGIFFVILSETRKTIKATGILFGFFTFFIPILIYDLNATNKIGGNRLSLMKIVDILIDTKYLPERVESILGGVSQIKYLFFSHLSNYLPAWVSWLTFFYFLILIIWALLSFQYKDKLKLDKNQLHLLKIIKNIALINVALIIFLDFMTLVSLMDFPYHNEIRYYYPLFPSMLLVVYTVLNYPSNLYHNIYSQIIKFISGIILGFFLVASLTLFASQPDKVFGFHYFDAVKDLQEYPSNLILNRHPASYQKLIEMLENSPKSIAISWAEDFDFSHSLNTNLRKRILPGPEYKQGNYMTSQSLKAYLIFNINKTCASYCYYDSRQEVTFIKSLPEVKTVYFNKKEKIQILYVTIPKGFSLSI